MRFKYAIIYDPTFSIARWWLYRKKWFRLERLSGHQTKEEALAEMAKYTAAPSITYYDSKGRPV